MTNFLRLDKWLWAVRLYKTRSDAAEACRGSAVRLNSVIAKPSAKVRIGDTIVARTKAMTRTLHVVGLTEKRVGAPRVPEFSEDRTCLYIHVLHLEDEKELQAFIFKRYEQPLKEVFGC